MAFLTVKNGCGGGEGGVVTYASIVTRHETVLRITACHAFEMSFGCDKLLV